MIIHPLAQAAIFALVLAEVMAAKLPGMANNKFAYAIYLLSGMLAWSLFSEIVSRCLTVFIDNGNLLKKMLFPRINLPLIIAGSALINNLLLLLAILVVFALLGHVPGGRDRMDAVAHSAYDGARPWSRSAARRFQRIRSRRRPGRADRAAAGVLVHADRLYPDVVPSTICARCCT